MTRAGERLVGFAVVVALAGAGNLHADTRLLVVTGVAADETDATRFSRWASTLVDAAVAHGVPDGNVVWLSGGHDARARERSTRENVARAFQDLAGRVHPDDEVVIVLIGHGSFDGRRAAFNLPGPDLSADDYAALLQKIPSQHVAFVNTSGASGAFLAPLAAQGRAIVTATATGGERNDTRFPEYFVEAFTTDAADRDHDGRVSLLEAFEYARTRVADTYKKEGLLQTEHAVLQDGTNGTFAATLALGAPAPAANAALASLIDEQRRLELQVAALRQRKSTMDQHEYETELERLLVELATRTRAIQRLQGRK